MTTLSRLSTASLGAIIRVADYARAKRFYEEKLGVAVMDAPGQPGNGTAQAGNGTMMYLYQSDLPAPGHTVAGFVVDDVPGVVAELRTRGIRFEEYDMPGLKTVDGIATMGEWKSAWFKDSEGNILSIGSM